MRPQQVGRDASDVPVVGRPLLARLGDREGVDPRPRRPPRTPPINLSLSLCLSLSLSLSASAYPLIFFFFSSSEKLSLGHVIRRGK